MSFVSVVASARYVFVKPCLFSGSLVHVQVTADGANDNLARIDPHADVHRRASCALDFVCIEGDPPLHAQGRIAGTNRVASCPRGAPKTRHDAVAHLVHLPLIPMDGFHHALTL